MAGIIHNITVQAYSGGTSYERYDIVENSDIYYVSAVDENQGNAPATTSNSFWKRFGDIGFEISDVWVPTHSVSTNNSPRTVSRQLSEGIIQRESDGINSLKQNIEVSFVGRKPKETQSLLAFFEFMGGKYAFTYTLPEPYNVAKKFVCSNWGMSYSSFRKDAISAIFRQSFNPIVSAGLEGEGQQGRV